MICISFNSWENHAENATNGSNAAGILINAILTHANAEKDTWMMETGLAIPVSLT